jgi:hypothetical protein
MNEDIRTDLGIPSLNQEMGKKWMEETSIKYG